MDHNIRCRQVQTCSPCLQRNTEYRCVILLEDLYHLLALFFRHRSGQKVIRNLSLVQSFAELVQHSSELGKQQYLVASCRRIIDQLQAKAFLGRNRQVILIKKSRAAADLPQFCEFRQDLELCIFEFFFILFFHKHFQPLHMGVINSLLFRLQLYISIFFQLVRQILQHIFFQPPQNKGPHHLLQFPGCLGILADNRLFKVSPERRIKSEKSGHQIIKNTPQLTKAVFHRRSCQRRPEL